MVVPSKLLGDNPITFLTHTWTLWHQRCWGLYGILSSFVLPALKYGNASKHLVFVATISWMAHLQSKKWGVCPIMVIWIFRWLLNGQNDDNHKPLGFRCPSFKETRLAWSAVVCAKGRGTRALPSTTMTGRCSPRKATDIDAKQMVLSLTTVSSGHKIGYIGPLGAGLTHDLLSTGTQVVQSLEKVFVVLGLSC